jgi:hypothetical protein
MKKLLLMAAAVAVIFSACTNEKETLDAGTLNVTLKIVSSGHAAPETKSTGAPGSGIKASINNGHVFIIDLWGNIIDDHALNVSQATSTGQVIPSIPADARIFVLGNVPADVVVTTPTTLTELLAEASDIFAQTNYAVPALGNANSTPVAITATSTTAGTANVQIRPLYSRLELAQVVGGTNADGDMVTTFTVTGVYVDSWYPKFTVAGLNSGTVYEQLTDPDLTGNLMGIAGNWAATGAPGAMVSIPGTGHVWYFHVPAGGLPRLIVRVTGVKYELASDGSIVDLSADTYYVTVKGYNVSGTPLTAFEAGRIYQIGGSGGITFNAPEHLHTVPNPTDIDLTLNVDILDWVVVAPDADLF